ncbi:MAG: DUF1059 domain-containing protein [Euryarchaeota archaeon]|nr:DUF1059 domain-containing protein [Euryarchaeota archaeon]
MATAKQFQCPFCAFQVTATDENEVMKHVKVHKQDHHPDADVSDSDIHDMIKDVEITRSGR